MLKSIIIIYDAFPAPKTVNFYDVDLALQLAKTCMENCVKFKVEYEF